MDDSVKCGANEQANVSRQAREIDSGFGEIGHHRFEPGSHSPLTPFDPAILGRDTGLSAPSCGHPCGHGAMEAVLRAAHYLKEMVRPSGRFQNSVRWPTRFWNASFGDIYAASRRPVKAQDSLEPSPIASHISACPARAGRERSQHDRFPQFMSFHKGNKACR